MMTRVLFFFFTYMPARLSAVSAVGLVSFPSFRAGFFCCDNMSSSAYRFYVAMFLMPP